MPEVLGWWTGWKYGSDIRNSRYDGRVVVRAPQLIHNSKRVINMRLCNN